MPSNIKRIRFLFFSLLLILLILAIVVPTRFVSQESGPARDQWQHPEAVMDALSLMPGSVVADVGAGDGYFTFHLAHRVGPQGKVYAVDIQENEVEKIRHQAEEARMSQIETIHGDPDNPKLPAGSLDAILVVNSYHEFRAYDAMLRGLLKALKPSGLLAIIDSPTERSSSRQEYHNRHRIPEEVVREEAARAGFRFLRKEPGFKRPSNSKEFYLLIFEKPAAAQAGTDEIVTNRCQVSGFVGDRVRCRAGEGRCQNNSFASSAFRHLVRLRFIGVASDSTSDPRAKIFASTQPVSPTQAP